MQQVKPPFWDGTKMNLPPIFNWGGRVGASPPNQRYPGWLNINRTQDFAISVTKVAGRHTPQERCLQQPQLNRRGRHKPPRSSYIDCYRRRIGQRSRC